MLEELCEGYNGKDTIACLLRKAAGAFLLSVADTHGCGYGRDSITYLFIVVHVILMPSHILSSLSSLVSQPPADGNKVWRGSDARTTMLYVNKVHNMRPSSSGSRETALLTVHPYVGGALRTQKAAQARPQSAFEVDEQRKIIAETEARYKRTKNLGKNALSNPKEDLLACINRPADSKNERTWYW